MNRSQTNHLLTSVVSKVPTPVYVYTIPEQQIIYTNPAVSNLVGYTLAELQQMGTRLIDTLIHPQDRSRIAEHHQRLLQAQDGAVMEVEYRLQQRSGTWCWLYSRDTVFARNRQGNGCQIVGLAQDITRWKERLEWFEHLLNTVPSYIYIYNVVDQCNVYVNKDLEDMLGYTQAELHTFKDGLLAHLLHPDDFAQVASIQQRIASAADGEIVQVEYRMRDKYENWHWLQDRVVVFARDAHGQMTHFIGSVQDVTASKQAEEERTAWQQQVIEAQKSALYELSTPLIPIADNIVVMPLIGAIDSTRVQQVIETLLEGVSRYQATTVILDITGVHVVDTQVANAFVRAAQAVKLLGAQVILTGVQPQIAQTLVHLGVDLEGIIAQSTLQAGVAFALAQKRLGRSHDG